YLLDLHSFPTRRSSDLSMFDLDRCRAGRHLAPKPDRSQVFNKSHIQLVSSFRLTCSMPTLSVSFIPLFFCRGRGLGWVAPVRCQDRKSTRLNSSHLVIS